IVPGSTLMYGSSLMLVTRMLRDSRIAARDAAAMPFPNEETTPPVTKTYFAIYLGRVGMEEFTGFFLPPLIHVHPLHLHPVVGAVNRANVFTHCPGNHLPMQRYVVDLRVVLGDGVGDLFFALFRVGFHARGVDQRVELLIGVIAVIEVAGALAVVAM